jgi:subtilisin family serine protease
MRVFVAIGAMLALLCGAGMAHTTGATANSTIFLRRAAFDPLTEQPTIAGRSVASSTLRLVQLTTPPDSSTAATLAADGMEVLLYIPENTFLVRVRDTAKAAAATVRWSGPYEPGYKLAETLDAALEADAAGTLALRVLLTSDADEAATMSAIRNLGGTVAGSYTGLNGPSLRVTLPASALATLSERDDVVWIEHDLAPRLSNDRVRAITEVDTARTTFGWLTGAGQVIAITDTGLDQQEALSADFAGRVAAGFSPRDMSSSCATSTWSDQDGHGTHVAGTALGSGALSSGGVSFAGIASEARIVVQAVASANSSGELDCLEADQSFLSKAYDAGARVQNASWGSPTGQSVRPPFSYSYGGYDDTAQLVDDFLWNHKDHLLVVAAGNSAGDANRDGVIDSDSIESPAVAKNVIAVGASESDRAPVTASCATSSSSVPTEFCWNAYDSQLVQPIANDFVSDDPRGMAAFSARGPTDDGRIKPDIVAPGSNIVSSRSHYPGASYSSQYNADYAYASGTSMAAPAVSGGAALVRQWLARSYNQTTPSAALVKALLLNGAANISPGQYGDGAQREIPAAWPNSVQGWGRLAIASSIGASGATIWFKDESAGLTTSAATSYSISAGTGQHVRVTLAWTDYPASPATSKTLVNDLDLEVQAPDGTVRYGNADASSSSSCRTGQADRCNTVESIAFQATQTGTYVVRVRGHSVVYGPQPFAVAAHVSGTAQTPPAAAPALEVASTSRASVTLRWSTVASASSYDVEVSTVATFATSQSLIAVQSTTTTIVTDIGSYNFRVRACNSAGCSDWSNVVSATTTEAPDTRYLPVVYRS